VEHPLIKDARVIGVPDAHYGEELCACVVLQENAVLTEEEIREYVAQRLAFYKVPRYVLYFKELPYNSTGKILVGRLKEMVMETGRIKG